MTETQIAAFLQQSLTRGDCITLLLILLLIHFIGMMIIFSWLE